MVVRRGLKTGEILVNLVTSSDTETYIGDVIPFDEDAFLKKLCERLLALPLEGKFAGIIHCRNNSLADVVTSEKTTILYGKDHFYEELLGLKFRITPFSFFQTNSLGAEVLYSTARELTESWCLTYTAVPAPLLRWWRPWHERSSVWRSLRRQ